MMRKLRKFIPKKGIWPEISIWRCLLMASLIIRKEP
jgi:hypothetical protein